MTAHPTVMLSVSVNMLYPRVLKSFIVCAQIEQEIAELDEDEEMFLGRPLIYELD